MRTTFNNNVLNGLESWYTVGAPQLLHNPDMISNNRKMSAGRYERDVSAEWERGVLRWIHTFLMVIVQFEIHEDNTFWNKDYFFVYS